MYNKRKYLKANDKKVLHKVKKQWITISLSLLMLIGGGAVATHVSANADATNNAPKTNVVANSAASSNNSKGSSQASQGNNTKAQSVNPVHNLGESRKLSVAPSNIQSGKWGTADYQLNQNTGEFDVSNGTPAEDDNWQGNISDSLHLNTNLIKTMNLNNVTAPANSSRLFDGLPHLTHISFNNFDTSHVQDMSFMFNNDWSLPSLDLSHFNTSNVTNMNSMFTGDTMLQSLDLSSFNTNKVTNMEWTFLNDVNLKSLTLGSQFNTNNVTNMDNMFGNDAILQLNIKPNANVKFSSNVGLQVPLYKSLGSDNYSQQPQDFSNGNNVGTFVNANVAKHIDYHTQPNQYFANIYPDLTNPQWNQNYHFNNPEGQNNDIETIVPVYNNAQHIDHWDIYYLWNPDPGNPGPNSYDEWGETTTKDFANFQPMDKNDPISLKNVAIPNPEYEINGTYRLEVDPSDHEPIPWYQVAGGSVISNKKVNGGQWLTHDTFGNPISPNARLAYFSNYQPSNHGSYLAYSNPDNNGNFEQYRPYSENMILNGSMVGIGMNGDAHDPFIIANPKNPNQLVAYYVGGNQRNCFVLTSSDAVHWTWKPNDTIDLSKYANSYAETPSIGTLNGTPVFFFSKNYGNEFAYLTGAYNNEGIFQATPNSKYGVVDSGPDVYAGNINQLDNNHLIFIGWLNNWSYFNSKHIGGFTLPRVLTLDANKNVLSTPIEPAVAGTTDNTGNAKNEYDVDGKVTVNFNQPTSHFNLNLSRVNNNNVNVVFNNGNLTVNCTGNAKAPSQVIKTVPVGANKLSNIEFYLDNISIEAYVPETHFMYSMNDFSNTRNAPYTLTCDTPAQITSYRFNPNSTRELDNVQSVKDTYASYNHELNSDLQVLANHMNNNLNTKANLIHGYLANASADLNNADKNIQQYNNFANDARQHVYVALANNDVDMANTQLHMANVALIPVSNVADQYRGVSAADAQIINYYKNSVANSLARPNQQAAQNAAHAADENIINQQKASVANSVNAANQQKANQAAQQADQRIAQQQRDSVANSVAVANRAKANHAAQIAEQNILNQQKQSVANSVNAANQRTATSYANSADKSIESSIANSYANSADTSIVNSYKNSASASVSAANSSYAKTAAGKAATKSGASSADKSIERSIASSYAKSADTSIANSYKNSVNTSVEAANQSKANSAAKSADTSIANSAAKSADNSIESSIANSYANSANNSIANSVKNSINDSVNVANQSKATSAAKSADQSIENSEEAKNAQNPTPASQSTPVTPINPAPITFNSVTPSSEARVSSSSVASSTAMPISQSTPESSASHKVTKPVTTHHNNTHKIALVGVNKRAYFTSKHYESKFTKYMRKHATVLEAIVKSNHNVAYKLQIGKHVGYVYGYLTKLAKPSFMNKKNAYIHVGKRTIKVHAKKFGYIRINKATQYHNRNYIKYNVTFGKRAGVMYGKLPVIKKAKKVANSKYYQFMPKHYRYAKVIKPLQMYSNKNFSKKTRKGAISKGITVRIKRVVKDGKFTRFELSNGKFITGLKSFSKLIK